MTRETAHRLLWLAQRAALVLVVSSAIAGGLLLADDYATRTAVDRQTPSMAGCSGDCAMMPGSCAAHGAMAATPGATCPAHHAATKPATAKAKPSTATAQSRCEATGCKTCDCPGGKCPHGHDGACDGTQCQPQCPHHGSQAPSSAKPVAHAA
jgi:hypothetical protein